MVFIFILSFSQIWLNLLVNNHHFGYNIKLTPKKKKKTPPASPTWVQSESRHQFVPYFTYLKLGTNWSPGKKYGEFVRKVWSAFEDH
jgi:hypothetical protein